MTETPARPMVFIATPCFGGLVSQHYMQSVLGLVQFGSRANFDVTLALLVMIPSLRAAATRW
jgi:hypothetical protein